MNSISAGYHPLNKAPQNLRAPGAAARAAEVPANEVNQPQAKARVSRLSSNGAGAHAVFSYGHTAALEVSGRLGSRLDIHI